ncbi:MAG: DUF459 domain-containing protein [Rhizobiaceae bacterium]|nr:DUF459 domain-containing protein [Rhizobiaceae bacterium]
MQPSIKLRCAVATCVTAAVLAGTLVDAGISTASAQELLRRPWSLFDIFRPKPRRYYIIPEQQPRGAKRPKKKSRTATGDTPAEPQVEIVEKKPDARSVLVVGDFLAGGLAEGLQAQFAQDATVRVLDLSKGSSGFVRQDYFNWNTELPAMLDAEKPAAVIVMMGSNDRQQMKVNNVSEAVRSENWLKEYRARVGALADMLEERKVPYLWMGMPSFKTGKMTSDMLAFNDLYRAAALANKGEFIDIWDGFADEQGSYVQTGPDVNGQPVKLRASDGINMTRQGKAKLAFYADKPLRKLLGLGAPGSGLPAENLPEAGPIGPTELPDRTPPMSLNDPEMDGGTELLGAQPAPVPTRGTQQAKPLALPQPIPGRADDFSWLRRQQELVPSVQIETTTAIRR